MKNKLYQGWKYCLALLLALDAVPCLFYLVTMQEPADIMAVMVITLFLWCPGAGAVIGLLFGRKHGLGLLPGATALFAMLLLHAVLSHFTLPLALPTVLVVLAGNGIGAAVRKVRAHKDASAR